MATKRDISNLTPEHQDRIERKRARDRAYAEAHREEAKARTKTWSAANPERKRATTKRWSEANPDRVKASDANSRENNRERRRQSYREHVDKDPELYRAKRRKWSAKNRERLNEKRRNLLAKNPSRRLSDQLRSRLAGKLRRELTGKTKAGSAVTDLGCTLAELKSHLETQFLPEMSWGNWGKGTEKWQIDHIIPLASFDLTDREQFKIACHYTNLQPLWHEDNIKKSDKVVVNGETVSARHFKGLGIISGNDNFSEDSYVSPVEANDRTEAA